jgi:hypothetical protein
VTFIPCDGFAAPKKASSTLGDMRSGDLPSYGRLKADVDLRNAIASWAVSSSAASSWPDGRQTVLSHRRHWLGNPARRPAGRPN